MCSQEDEFPEDMSAGNIFCCYTNNYSTAILSWLAAIKEALDAGLIVWNQTFENAAEKKATIVEKNPTTQSGAFKSCEHNYIFPS